MTGLLFLALCCAVDRVQIDRKAPWLRLTKWRLRFDAAGSEFLVLGISKVSIIFRYDSLKMQKAKAVDSAADRLAAGGAPLLHSGPSRRRARRQRRRRRNPLPHHLGARPGHDQARTVIDEKPMSRDEQFFDLVTEHRLWIVTLERMERLVRGEIEKARQLGDPNLGEMLVHLTNLVNVLDDSAPLRRALHRAEESLFR